MPETQGGKSGLKQQADTVWVLLATILGSSMAFIDGSAVGVALPVLQTDLGATVADTQWVIEGYTLFLGALILVGGSLGDRYGQEANIRAGHYPLRNGFRFVWIGAQPRHVDPGALISRRGRCAPVPGSLSIINAVIAPDQRGKAIGTGRERRQLPPR